MMYWYGSGWAWMMLMPLVWIAVIGAIIFLALRFVPRPGGQTPDEHRRETPQEILDRRFASGEIDIETYRQARSHLAERGPGSP